MTSKWEILKDKGNEEFRKHNYTAAISLYSDSIKMDPSQDSSYSNRGLCYLSIKKYSQAKADLTKAVTLNSKNLKALKRLAFCYLSLGELGEAEMFLKRCVEVEPEEASHRTDVKLARDLIAKTELLHKNKFVYDYKACESLAEEILQKCTEATNIKLIYLESLLQNCKAGEALAFIKSKSTDEEIKREDFQYLMCQAYYQDGKYEKAKQILTTLIAKANDTNLDKYEKLWNNLKQLETEKEKANELFKKGDYDGAIALYTKLLDMDTNNKTFNATILSNRALCYQKKNKLFDALTDINKCISLNPNYWKAYYRRATINVTLKNAVKAKEDLNKVLQLDSNNRDAVMLLDDIQREEKKSLRRDFYKILDLKRTATSEEIRKSFKKLASQWHPDKNTETPERREHAEKMFKDINEAYNILSDCKKRKIYDEGGHPDDPNSKFHTQDNEETYEDIYKTFFGGAGASAGTNAGTNAGYTGHNKTNQQSNNNPRSHSNKKHKTHRK